ncbi:hypothetical protein FB451DRAFT_1409109 [Mycena latifolia]|nr:hypothetical protein FB451DRAFT_1409109 [Mycena latifolia]
MAKDPEYDPLIHDPVDEYEDDVLMKPAPATFSYIVTVLAFVVATETLALAIAIFLLSARAPLTTSNLPPHAQRVLYSPALEAVEHEVQAFHIGVPGDLTTFQVPSSPALDEMWDNLYNGGISRITKEEAARLPNKTQALVILGVFHELHCLNKIRMALDPDYYPEARVSTTSNFIPSQKDATLHISHCLDYLRQAAMCHGDTSAVVLQWDYSENKVKTAVNVAHTCRKFDKLQDWAKERMMNATYDNTIRIDDNIIIPIIHSEIP